MYIYRYRYVLTRQRLCSSFVALRRTDISRPETGYRHCNNYLVANRPLHYSNPSAIMAFPTPVTNLDVILSTLSPYLDKTEIYIFHTDRKARYGDHASLSPIATIQEDEGLTLIVPLSEVTSQAKANGGDIDIDLENSTKMRRITLGVHSSLEAVGLTAAVSTELADHGISANMVAAYHHDHVFVPIQDAERAADLLIALASRAKTTMDEEEKKLARDVDASEEDAAAAWDSLAPLHVERVVDHSKPTFTVPFEIDSKQFVIQQDCEGRRRPAFDKDNNTEKDEDLTEFDSKTGAVLWDGAVVVAGVLERASTMAKSDEFRNQLNPRNKVCVELGCGCSALPGLAATALGASRVVLTDMDVIIQSNALQQNLKRNLDEDLVKDISCVSYEWGTEPLPSDMSGAQLILAADCVYDIALVEPLLHSIEMLMNESARRSSDCVALVAFDTSIGRHKAYDLFEAHAKKRFHVVELLGHQDGIMRGDLSTDAVRAYVLAKPTYQE